MCGEQLFRVSSFDDASVNQISQDASPSASLERSIHVKSAVLGHVILVDPTQVLITVRLGGILHPNSGWSIWIITAEDVQSSVQPTQLSFELATEHVSSPAPR